MIMKHISIDSNIDSKVKSYAETKKIKYSKAVRELLEKGISNNETINKINKILINSNYLVKLHEQAYTDLGVEFYSDVEANKKLKKFKEKINNKNFDD
jgi:predicted transcriptional regulator